jgi:predicted DNA-binding protein YlxM (UPF0122 family)
MWVEVIEEIRKLTELKNISDEEIAPYIEIAQNELDNSLKNNLKALSFYTLKLLGQKLWHKIQQRANEYDETLETFKDVQKWEEYWQERLNALRDNAKIESFFFGAI